MTGRILWQLKERMTEVGFDRVVDLYDQIKRIDPGAVKYAQLARIVADPPARLNLRVLAVLCQVLDCRPGDIIDVANVRRKPDKAGQKKSQKI